MTAKKYWIGAVSDCDLCHRKLAGVMYDANVPAYGVWGNICQDCFDAQGCQLGTGFGQKFEQQPDGRWLKVAG